MNNLETLVLLLLQSIGSALDLLACQRIVPLYTETVYIGMCTYTPSAVFWVFASCLVMGVMGMIMLTTRASYKRTYYTIPHPDAIAADHHDDDGAGAVVAAGAAAGAAGLAAQADEYSNDDVIIEPLVGASGGAVEENYGIGDSGGDTNDKRGSNMASGSGLTGTSTADSLQLAVNDETTTVADAAATSPSSLPRGPSRTIPRPPSGYDQEAGRRHSSSPADRLSALMG